MANRDTSSHKFKQKEQLGCIILETVTRRPFRTHIKNGAEAENAFFEIMASSIPVQNCVVAKGHERKAAVDSDHTMLRYDDMSAFDGAYEGEVFDVKSFEPHVPPTLEPPNTIWLYVTKFQKEYCPFFYYVHVINSSVDNTSQVIIWKCINFSFTKRFQWAKKVLDDVRAREKVNTIDRRRAAEAIQVPAAVQIMEPIVLPKGKPAPDDYIFGLTDDTANALEAHFVKEDNKKKNKNYFGKGLYHYFHFPQMSKRQFRNSVGKFFKRNKTAQTVYDRAMGFLDQQAGSYQGLAHDGSGMYTGPGMYTGAGAYVAGNDLIAGPGMGALPGPSKSSMDVVPRFTDVSDEGVIMSRREYVSEIYGPANSSFSIQSFPLNPGLELTFPWLSQIAQNYDEYDLLQCIFTFKSTTTESVNSANGQVGTVIMATAYNATSPNFTDKVTMLQYEFSNSSRLTESMQHGVECDPSKLSGSRGEYIRNNPIVAGQDLKTYDHGKFQIAIANCASAYFNQSIGELWVSYTVRLRKAKFYTALGLGISKDIFVSSGGETILNPLGTNVLRGQQNNIGTLVTATNDGIINTITMTFPASYKGHLRVMLSIGAPVDTATGLIASYTTCNYSGNPSGGNVVNVADLYGGNSLEVLDSPNSRCLSTSVTFGLLVVLHISVNIATSGVNNTFAIETRLNAAAGVVPHQTYLELAEYNSGFSYLATGLASSTAPVFVNSSGVVVIPANS